MSAPTELDASFGQSCSASQGDARGCHVEDGGAAVAKAFGSAAAAGCTISGGGAKAQLARVELLRPHVAGIERRPGSVAISFDPVVERDALDEFVKTERRCCSFLEIRRQDSESTLRVTFSSDDPKREPAIEAIGELLDPSAPIPAIGHRSGEARKTATMAGAVGLACLACCLPPLLAAGALGSLVATFGGTAGIAAGIAVFLGLAAIFAIFRQRSRGRTSSCGC